VWLATLSAQAVGVRLHDVEVRPTREESHWVGHLGPDIMADGFDADAAAEILVGADRPLVEALLDQRLVCGMGTIWASELASAAGVDPRAATSTVSGLSESLSVIRIRMLRAVDAAPSVIRRELRVYERSGQPCRSCGTPIRSGRVGVAPMARTTYWCPSCQPIR
jgi:endonuclease-8